MIQVQHSSAIYHCYNQYIVMGRVYIYKGRFQYTLCCCCGLVSELGGQVSHDMFLNSKRKYYNTAYQEK